jgi:hypothetical protein
MTTHYSEAELANLIAAAQRACDSKSRKIPASSWATSAVGTEVEANSLTRRPGVRISPGAPYFSWSEKPLSVPTVRRCNSNSRQTTSRVRQLGRLRPSWTPTRGGGGPERSGGRGAAGPEQSLRAHQFDLSTSTLRRSVSRHDPEAAPTPG